MEQTNRTILFEQVNLEKRSLLEMIGEVDGADSLSDEVIYEIHRELTVHSLSEYLAHFQPAIDVWIHPDTLETVFSEEPFGTREGVQHIILNDQHPLVHQIKALFHQEKTIWSMEMDLYRLMEETFITGKQDSLLKARKQLKYCFEQNLNPEPVIIQLKESMKDIPSLEAILLKEWEQQKKEQNIDKKKKHIILEERQQLQIKLLAVSKSYEQYEDYYMGDQSERYCDWLKKLGNQETFLSNDLLFFYLTLRCDFSLGQNAERAEWIREKQKQYISFVRRYYMALRPKLEMIAGVAAFFAQYDNCRGEVMTPSMIVTNCSIQMFQNENNRKRLMLYLETVNEKNFSNDMIWYAIIPRIPPMEVIENGAIRERFRGSGTDSEIMVNSLEAVSLLTEILEQYQVQMFVSMAANSKNTFHSFKKESLWDFIETFRPLARRNGGTYVIPCYPNITLVQSQNATGEFFQRTVTVEGIYLEASYVAAGLLAACQSPEYLSGWYKKVDMETPGVAYRLCSEGHNLVTTSTIGKEILWYSQELLQLIQEYAVGIVLGPGDCRNRVSKIIALTDRTLAYGKDEISTIATVQTFTYLERRIRENTQDFKNKLIKNFFIEYTGSTIEKWKKNRFFVNSLLREEEDIKYQMDSLEKHCTFLVTFRENQQQNTVTTDK